MNNAQAAPVVVFYHGAAQGRICGAPYKRRLLDAQIALSSDPDGSLHIRKLMVRMGVSRKIGGKADRSKDCCTARNSMLSQPGPRHDKNHREVVRNLTIIDSEYSQLVTTNTVANIIKDGQSVFSRPVITTNARTYTASISDETIIATDPKAIITLPAPSETRGRSYTIKNASAQDVTVQANGVIDGATRKILGDHASITVRSDGKKWYIVGQLDIVRSLSAESEYRWSPKGLRV